jgi:hypothetical protein
MRSTIVVIILALSLAASVAAGPRKAIVLPLDGNAPAAQKTQLNASVAKLAKSGIVGSVTIGDATFDETAAAVGCKPEQPACAETVRSTLGVDELVYGTATTENGTTTVTLHRVTKGGQPSSRVAAIGETDAGTQAEGALGPLFPMATPAGSGSDGGGSDGAGSGSNLGSDVAGSAGERRSFFDTRERKVGFALAAGGALALAIGFSMWASKSGLQEDIDNHPTSTLAELQDLARLEDRAATKAMWGNILVGVGLGLGGAGAYYLYKDHQHRKTTITPVPTEGGTGMTLVLGGRW